MKTEWLAISRNVTTTVALARGGIGQLSKRIEPFGATVTACGLFVALAPFLVDTYNTLNQRAFLDLIFIGNPFSLAQNIALSFRGQTWMLDWPYPPLTLLFDLPAWLIFRLTQSEAIYQLAFKLPLFITVLITQWLILRINNERGVPQTKSLCAGSYLLNPAVIIFTTVAGGFDVIAALLILLAYYLFVHDKMRASALALGTAGALRLYPLALLPVYVLCLWKTSRSRLSNVAVYIALCFAPLAFSCLPFAVNDWKGFVATLTAGQTAFGPFATVNFVSTILYDIAVLIGYSFDVSQTSYFFVAFAIVFLVLTGLGLVFVYRRIAWAHFSLLEANLLVLLVFFLFYPKVHGLYTVALLPLALVASKRIASWVWLPGTIWMLSVNGAFGATGFWYWLAPITGAWISLVPKFLAFVFTIVLTWVQAYLIVGAIGEVRLHATSTANSESR